MVSALGRLAPPDYYIDSQQTLHGPRRGAEGEEEMRGAWWNPGALFHLSDGNPVDADAFRNLYRGCSPDGRTELKWSRSRRRSGVDLVFPADKSVSALWALADPATGRLVEQAHDDAVRVALLEVFARYAGWVFRERIGVPQGMMAADFMGATFRHGSSRENDPHLHTHCVVFNFARARDDGAYRALQTSPLRSWLKAAGSVYRHALAWNLGERIGVGCEQYGRGEGYIRVPGMPRGLIRDWSKRRRTMTAAMQGAGLRIEGASSPQTVLFARATRAGTSDRHPELESLRPAWMRERDAHVADAARLIASLPGPDRSGRRLGEVLQKLDRLPESLAADKALFSFPSVVEAVFNVTAGHMDRRAAMAWAERVLARDDVVRIDDPGRSRAARADLAHVRLYARRETAESGDAVRDAARELAADRRFGVPPAAVQDRIEALLDAGYPLATADIRGIRHGTSASRIAVLEFAAAVDRSLVLRPIGDLYREQRFEVLGVAVTPRSAAELHNESGVATVQLDRLLKMDRSGALDRNRAAVFVVADAGLLTAGQLGKLFDLAERYCAKILLVAVAGQRPLLATEPGLDLVADIVGRIRMAGPAAAAGPASAIAARAVPGRVRFGAGLEETLERIADDWDLSRGSGPVGRVAVVARTRVEEKALTHVLRTRLLGGPGGGPRAVIRVHWRAGIREYGASVPLEIRTGDWLRIGVTLWEKQLFSGSVVAVEDIVPRPSGTEEPRFLIRAATEGGRRVEFHHDDVRDSHGGVRLGHGYAFTVDEVTGRFDRVLALADGRWRAEQFDRAAACCRGELDIHVNRAPLAAAIRPPDGRTDASAAEDEAQTLDRLGRLWSPARDGDGAAGAGHRETEKLYPDAHHSATGWLAANDGGGGSLRRLGREIALSAYRVRHGETVEAVATGRAEVLAEWARHRERFARDGDSALLSPSVGETARRHKALLDVADTLPQLTCQPMRDLLAACGGPKAAEMREFRELYRRMRTDRRIAAARQRLNGAPDGAAAARTQRPEDERRAGAAADPVRAYLAEVARCRRFRRFLLDAAARQGFPADELPSWAHCRDDGDRLIAQGREILSGSAARAPRAGGADAAVVRAAVAALEEERGQDWALHGRPPVGAAVRPRAGDPGGGPAGERLAAGEHERHRRTAGQAIGY